MEKIKGIFFWGIMALVVFAGCGKKNAEMVEACQTRYAELVDEHNVVIALYADSPTEEYGGQLEGLGDKVKEIGELDVGEMEGEELDALMAEMKVLTDEYEEIYHRISKMMEEEEETEYCQVSVTLKNMTSLSFHEIYFYNIADESTRVNLVTDDPEEFDGLEIFNLVNLTMEKGQTVWHLETMDPNGIVIESEDIDLAPYEGGNVVIEMMFSFDTFEGWVEIK